MTTIKSKEDPAYEVQASDLIPLVDSLGVTAKSVTPKQMINGASVYKPPATVAAMKALNLPVGVTISTQGYYAAGDGGAATYLIVAPQAFDGYGDHELANGNIAVLQIVDMPNWKEFGCKGDNSSDDTLPGQAIIDYAELTNTDTFAPEGVYLGNWTAGNQVVINGAGKNATIFGAFADDAIFKTSLTTSSVRFGWRRCKISGDVTKTSNDGIVLKTTTASTFIDDVVFDDVDIRSCGRYGLHVFGSSVNGPFVQGIDANNLFIRDCVDNGLRLEGTVLECDFIGGGCVSNGSVDGTKANSYIGIESGSGQIPRRITLANFRMNHAKAILDAGYTSAVIAPACQVAGATQISFNTCDLESANPMIQISGSLTENITVDTCNLGSSDDAVSFITVSNVTGFKVSNSRFAAPVGTIDQAFIYQDNLSESKVYNVDIQSTNSFSSGKTATSFTSEHTIASGVINNRNINDPSIIIVDTEANAATDDLDNIYDRHGGTSSLIDGQIAILSTAANTRDVTITQNGHIVVAGATYVLDHTQDTFVAMWSQARGLWLQTGGSNNA